MDLQHSLVHKNRSYPTARIAKFFAVAGLLLTIAACSRPEHATHTEQMLVEGMLISASYHGLPADQIAPTQAIVEQTFRRFYAKTTVWRTSPVTQLNTELAKGESVAIDPELMDLIRHAQALELASGGLFNPAIGGLIRRWGFHQDSLPQQPLDQETKQRYIKDLPSMQDLVFSPDHKITSTNPQLELDFGAIAEGYALMLVKTELHKRGIQHALINAAGDVMALGSHGDRPWKVGIRDPQNEHTAIFTLALNDGETATTSGNYERFFVANGHRFHHIIDPRTGEPTEGAQAVTVIDDDPIKADAAATALMVAGPDEWYSIAKRMKIYYVLLLDQQGHLHMNPEMAARAQIALDPKPTVKLSASLR